MKLVGELVAGAACARASWIAALRHEILNDAVERHGLVESLAGEEHEIVDGTGRFVRKQFDDNVALVQLERRNIFFLGINHHFRRFRKSLGHLFSLITHH